MSFDLQLTDRRALVTGGTKGVGAAVVDVLRNAGARSLIAACVRNGGEQRDCFLSGVQACMCGVWTGVACALPLHASSNHVINLAGRIDDPQTALDFRK